MRTYYLTREENGAERASLRQDNGKELFKFSFCVFPISSLSASLYVSGFQVASKHSLELSST